MWLTLFRTHRYNFLHLTLKPAFHPVLVHPLPVCRNTHCQLLCLELLQLLLPRQRVNNRLEVLFPLPLLRPNFLTQSSILDPASWRTVAFSISLCLSF